MLGFTPYFLAHPPMQKHICFCFTQDSYPDLTHSFYTAARLRSFNDFLHVVSLYWMIEAVVSSSVSSHCLQSCLSYKWTSPIQYIFCFFFYQHRWSETLSSCSHDAHYFILSAIRTKWFNFFPCILLSLGECGVFRNSFFFIREDTCRNPRRIFHFLKWNGKLKIGVYPPLPKKPGYRPV